MIKQFIPVDFSRSKVLNISKLCKEFTIIITFLRLYRYIEISLQYFNHNYHERAPGAIDRASKFRRRGLGSCEMQLQLQAQCHIKDIPQRERARWYYSTNHFVTWSSLAPSRLSKTNKKNGAW